MSLLVPSSPTQVEVVPKLTGRCRYKPICTELRKILRCGGVSRSAILQCPSVRTICPCGSFTANTRSLYHSLPGEHATDVLRLLEAVLGKKEPLLLPEFSPLQRQKDFFCPELGITMHQPCRVKACPFQTASAWLGNCVLNYYTSQERSGLNYAELTFLLGESSADIRRKLNQGLRKLRVGALRDKIQRTHEPGVVTLIRGQKQVCAVCERVPDPKEALTKSKWYYCGKNCYSYKPPQVLELEAEYNLPVEKLLRIGAAHFPSMAVLAPLFHFTQPSLRALYTRYGISPPQS